MRIVVTGAEGRIGYGLCDDLSAAGHDVLGLDLRLVQAGTWASSRRTSAMSPPLRPYCTTTAPKENDASRHERQFVGGEFVRPSHFWENRSEEELS